jgi:RHS repeat-associated protein
MVSLTTQRSRWTDKVQGGDTTTGPVGEGAIEQYYYRHRMYAAELGRFLTRDPIGYGDGSNLLQRQRPVNGVDPFGDMVVEGKMTCAEFLESIGRGGLPFRPGDLIDLPGIPDHVRKRLRRGGDHLFCGNCHGNDGYAWRHGTQCHVCFDANRIGYPDQWIGLLTHELTHCDQYKCRLNRKPTLPIIGNPIRVPILPPPPCKKCMDDEEKAYRWQCVYLFPTDEKKQEDCIEAGICRSCESACRGNKQYRRRCQDKAIMPPFFPEPLPISPGIVTISSK